MKFVFLLLLLFIVSLPVFAKIEIEPYRKKYFWDNSWNDAISNEIDQKINNDMITEYIDQDDLISLGCPGFNSADADSKKDFWIVFLSSLARAESAFNTKVRSRAPKGGHGNYGLLQLSKATAREQCGINDPKDIADPAMHLRCGVKLLAWQLKGAPVTETKFLRPDLKGQLFGKYILLWGPLRQNDKRGRALLVSWFKKHLDQMPFCSIKAE
ncbi:MAG: lytic transglycosylase domain-containing protein [Bacteriovorax sp.]|nr:lytic transglycosylase domain-containing protein [Bacteriovorax sp.]